MEALWGKTIPDAIYHQIFWGKAVFLGLINSLFHFCFTPLGRNDLCPSIAQK